MTTVELRCSENPSKLLAKVNEPTLVDGNLVEIACRDCARRMRHDDDSVRQVLHRFDVTGELIETEVVR